MTEVRNITQDLESQLQAAVESIERWAEAGKVAKDRLDLAANQQLYWRGRADALRDLLAGASAAATNESPANEPAPEANPVSPFDSAKSSRRTRSPKK